MPIKPRRPQPDTVPAGAARAMLMHGQGLVDDPARRATSASVFRAIERMGFVQLDTITVVERAHHHILSTRFDDYRPEVLDRLHRAGRLFEHKTHDASLIPAQWFPHWRLRFDRPEWRAWIEGRLGSESAILLDATVARIRDHGPHRTRDFEGPDGAPRAGPWWDWRPEKAALEFLWRTGRLAVAGRDGFNKVYDLPERVLPAVHALPAPSPDEHLDWACSTALDRVGIATHGELAAFWKSVSPSRARAWCLQAVRDGRIVPVLVESADGSPSRAAYAPLDWRRRAGRVPDPPDRTRILSPFDPVIRDRDRCLRLFNFHYRFEAFVPAAKRRYGYYILPILEGDRITGRLDAKLYRDAGELRVAKLWWEPGIRLTKARRSALDAALDRLSSFLGARRWTSPRRRA